MITIQITEGPTFTASYTQGMNVQNAFEAAYNSATSGTFTYALQYYGSQYGYLVLMINETYETFNSTDSPFYFWEFLVNGTISPTGIDSTILNDGDVVTFSFLTYNPSTHAESTLQVKYQAKISGATPTIK